MAQQTRLNASLGTPARDLSQRAPARVPDGGGIHSTAGWGVPPISSSSALRPFRKALFQICVEYDLRRQLMAHCEQKPSGSYMGEDVVNKARLVMANILNLEPEAALHRNTYQAFHLHFLLTLALKVHDTDVSLAEVEF